MELNTKQLLYQPKRSRFLPFSESFDSTVEQFSEGETFELQMDIMHSIRKVKAKKQSTEKANIYFIPFQIIYLHRHIMVACQQPTIAINNIIIFSKFLHCLQHIQALVTLQVFLSLIFIIFSN